MHRTLPCFVALALLAGCPRAGGPKLAQLHVSCASQTFDGNSTPPEQGQSCAPGSQVTLSYDNDGGYGYVIVYAVTRDALVFWLPDSDSGESVAIQPNGKGVALPGTFSMPTKTRDVMAIFSKEPLKAKDIAQRTRDVTLGQLQNVGEIRVRLSGEYGPIN
jgi:hypothetical protein